MKFKRSNVIIAAVVILLGALWIRGFWFTEVFHSSKRKEPNRAALIQIRAAVNVGASHADVLAAYWSNRADELKLFADRPTDWIIQMPLEFGASDWKLYIDFKDGRVNAVKVRTSDGAAKDGPPDKE
ncbi:MAG: hypothetical protein HY298_24640 [Verrucomicrobia bacterium]|nr:hypothetical protein [Verrucomicrobiota bacterium]